MDALRGAGAQASRLVCGNLDLHEQVEAKLARLKGAEAALLLASGWQANAAVLPALLRAAAGQGEVQLYADKLNHASLHHGCQAAGVKQIRYRHNDLDHLESLLSARAEPGPGGKPAGALSSPKACSAWTATHRRGPAGRDRRTPPRLPLPGRGARHRRADVARAGWT